MLDLRLYMLQRLSALVMAPLVLGHLALMIYAVQGGISAGEILARTQGSLGWALYYGLFLVAAAIHAAIGLRVILAETLTLRNRPLLDLFTPRGGCGLPDPRPARPSCGDARMISLAHRSHPLWLAYLVHRLSGLGLALFLPVHFYMLAMVLTDPEGFDSFGLWTQNPLVKMAEFGLVFLPRRPFLRRPPASRARDAALERAAEDAGRRHRRRRLPRGRDLPSEGDLTCSTTGWNGRRPTS